MQQEESLFLFKTFPKIPRFRTIRAYITEKLDGTNAQILVPEDPDAAILAGSRHRWLTTQNDNFGFAKFVEANTSALRALGPGRHYGEWWGKGIQRQYGLAERRFWLFAPWRYEPTIREAVTDPIGFVPVLYAGGVDTKCIEDIVAKLYADGSVAAPGWAKPEGVVISIGAQLWKVTDNGDNHKGKDDDLVLE